jgi:hypothetical protein
VTGNDVRSRIADLVRGVQPFDGREAADQADILDWVASGKQLFRTLPPDTPPKHLADTFDPEMHRFAAKLREKTAEDIRATSGWTNP